MDTPTEMTQARVLAGEGKTDRTRRVASEEHLEDAYRTHGPRLRRLAAAIAGADAANDVVQDAFAQALRKRRSWRGDGPLEAWLWRLVLNAARDAERRRVRRDRLADRLLRAFERHASPHVVDDALHAPLRLLPTRQRDCIVLRYFGDLSYAEIGEVMGIEPGTVGALLSKAQAQAAALDGLPPAGKIAHVRDEYRDPTGHAFISYEAWVASDGSWCREVVEEAVTDYTLCESAGGVYEFYLPAANEILRARPGAQPQSEPAKDCVAVPEGAAIEKTKDGLALVLADGTRQTFPQDDLAEVPFCDADSNTPPEGDFLTGLDDFLETFQLEIAGQAGTMTIGGVEYAKLATTGGDFVLVDPDNGQAIAWIPNPEAFGMETIVWRTNERLDDTPEARRTLSLEQQHPDAELRDVSLDELRRAIGEQYPRG